METSLTEDERVAAIMGRGVEVAKRRMSLFAAEEDPVRAVGHALAAIDALTSHLQHVERARASLRKQPMSSGPIFPPMRSLHEMACWPRTGAPRLTEAISLGSRRLLLSTVPGRL